MAFLFPTEARGKKGKEAARERRAAPPRGHPPPGSPIRAPPPTPPPPPPQAMVGPYGAAGRGGDHGRQPRDRLPRLPASSRYMASTLCSPSATPPRARTRPGGSWRRLPMTLSSAWSHGSSTWRTWRPSRPGRWKPTAASMSLLTMQVSYLQISAPQKIAALL
ncbi:hypothetical protein SORBI_3003G413300 [Sorghum bicolor]|uniref:Uncharacterized protein n=2 Tax=Sorghum bicolor TaxID=4558 RepID=A0A1B6Q804_SORBI|nr:hypothetical protein SORBI_3003G413300 [Sorghum bicolor]